MLFNLMNELKIFLQSNPNKNLRNLFSCFKKIRTLEIPTPKILNKGFYILYKITTNILENIVRILFNTPIFKGRLSKYGKNLYLYDGIPLITGPLEVSVGNDCRISGQTTFSGRSLSKNPKLKIGNNADIGWQTTIAVGKTIIIEDNVRIAERSLLFGYSGHPLNAQRRANGESDEEIQTGDIHLKRDVWLGSNVTVFHSVTIGEGTVVAASSVVTKDLPSFVIAAGNPAKIVATIEKNINGRNQCNVI
ncbi:acetyltransferase [Candidatus Photodesmus blepharus]|uniref:Acetyltransferase n=1 Tax=Candidatus Photodesmus blepharonis TaxID=1179155 RepID=A0A084CPE2_9GAMM|nr:acyltransferase [Candidatus Photodesmus blepharus]KEY91671.1 acetyltransferase [Candidatus Photodesmus blepharus]